PVETPPAPAAKTPPAIATIKDIRRAVLADVVRVVIELDAEVQFHEERLANPARVFVDLSSTRASAALRDQTIKFDGDGEIVREIRLGRHPNETTRVVLEAEGVTSFSVYPLYSPYRLIIDCARVEPLTLSSIAGTIQPIDPIAAGSRRASGPNAPAPPASVSAATSAATSATSSAASSATSPAATPHPPAPIAARSLRASRLGSAPTVKASAADLIAEARLPDAPTVSVAGPPVLEATASTTIVSSSTPPAPLGTPISAAGPSAPLPSAPDKNLAGGFSIARQLGLGVSRIVIDPGHGGHDPGAKGNGLTEASLVLDVALRLEKLLKDAGVDVVLTRRTDEFVPLQERTAIANREGADLFLSIHANASTSRTARGIESYFLNFATNPSAEAIAARENAGSDQSMAALPKILNTIALNNKLDESRDLAIMVQRAMIENLRSSDKSIRDLGVKQAPFVVLIGAAMPSVLSEISFLTNAQEAKLLKNTTYRQRIAEALFNAVRKYQTALKSTGKIAARP
ncbi:MAG TPA: N-acetylmuramoyl-L-alanine amidase, partial [Vicinamibacterales bacterium]|nr:N-acetylmuramoyl-L-alanine amidase [Vicinamibacterales bacterium]